MRRKTIYERIAWSLRERGGYRTIVRIFAYISDWLFDRRYRVDTLSTLRLCDMGIEDDKKKHTNMYGASRSVSLRKLFKTTQVKTDGVLVDLGCGKGKALMIASEFGFREVRGVELSPLLCEIADKNCSVYKTLRNTNTNFRIFNSDAREYSIHDDEDIFYLFNPFDQYVLDQVLQNILHSFQRNRRKIWIIYGSPIYSEVIEKKFEPDSVSAFNFWDASFAVYAKE